MANSSIIVTTMQRLRTAKLSKDGLQQSERERRKKWRRGGKRGREGERERERERAREREERERMKGFLLFMHTNFIMVMTTLQESIAFYGNVRAPANL